MGALLSLMVIYLAYTSYDWDWNVFAVTVPFFFFAGMLAGMPVQADNSGKMQVKAARLFL